jgi:hypothetical protein
MVCYWSPGGGTRSSGLPTIEDVYAWSNGSVLAYVYYCIRLPIDNRSKLSPVLSLGILGLFEIAVTPCL